jgi:hypothetical protein
LDCDTAKSYGLRLHESRYAPSVLHES